MSDFNAALSFGQTYEWYLNRASLKFALKDFSGALVDLDKASELDKMGYEAYFDKGFIYMQAGNSQSAIMEFNKAIAINNTDFESYLKRGIAKNNLKDYTGAIDDLNSSVKLKPSADAFYYRGICNMQLKKTTEGCADLKQALTMGNSDAQAKLQQYCK
jgi:tetratricopeptide (TPR) repeat protein